MVRLTSQTPHQNKTGKFSRKLIKAVRILRSFNRILSLSKNPRNRIIRVKPNQKNQRKINKIKTKIDAKQRIVNYIFGKVHVNVLTISNEIYVQIIRSLLRPIQEFRDE